MRRITVSANKCMTVYIRNYQIYLSYKAFALPGNCIGSEFSFEFSSISIVTAFLCVIVHFTKGGKIVELPTPFLSIGRK